MRDKPYYSLRTGKHDGVVKLDLDATKKLFLAVYRSFDQKDYFQEAFGYQCVDAGYVVGTAGQEIDGAMILALRKDHLCPIEERLSAYTEDDFFDVVEFLHDHISKPLEGHYHSYYSCGMHYSKFNRIEGQAEFRAAINPILACLDSGFALADDGEILHLAEPGFAPLLEAELPPTDEDNVEGRVAAAVKRFRRQRSSLEDRRHALRDLADVLEYLRPQIKSVLVSKDESDLFNIANNFGIRHHNEAQRTGYDAGIWFSWMFYYYLATIHTVLRLLQRKHDDA
jgi:hypothetical protein